MNNTGFYNNYQYPQNSGTPKPEVGAVNISINGINTPGMGQPYNYGQPSYYGQSQGYYPPPVYYPMPVYYPVQYTPPQNQNQNQSQTHSQENKSIPSQNINKEEPKKKEEKKPEKDLTPITPDLLDNLNNALAHGTKEARIHAVGRLLKLLREDPDTRKKDPRLIGLINTALHPNQPDEVQTAAIIGVNNGIVDGNAKTRQLLNTLSNQHNMYGTDSLASSALMRMPGSTGQQDSSTRLNPASEIRPNQATGQKLNVISQ